MNSYAKFKADQTRRTQEFPMVYHDIHAIQLVQHINGYLVKNNFCPKISPQIQDLYEKIASNLYKYDTKSKQDKPILLSGTDRKVVIAYCIHSVCVLNNIECDKYAIAASMGLRKKRMAEIEQKYCLDSII